ncbi:MAG: polyprenyl synthetase family protein [Turicibacter sp.]|nr:polyprenyl synthetase family protein [Turicibacter sp.]
MNLHAYMEQLKNEIDAALMAHQYSSTHTVAEAMRYSLRNGGKRFRPVLLLMFLDAFGVERKKGMATAVALEMIHTYSLIHDDLPAMDDDDMRRGHPTNHKVYGEAVAILAGDGLLTDAFNVLVNDQSLDIDTRLKLVRLLSAAAGSCGMIEGQMLDMEAEVKPVEDLEKLKNIHQLKTGKLIEFACLAAGFIADPTDRQLHKLRWFSNHVGLAFQIQDDILDVEGDAEKIGKTVGSDEASGKSTYVSLLGLDGAKAMLEAEINKAVAELDGLPADTEMLKELTLYVAGRDS